MCVYVFGSDRLRTPICLRPMLLLPPSPAHVSLSLSWRVNGATAAGSALTDGSRTPCRGAAKKIKLTADELIRSNSLAPRAREKGWTGKEDPRAGLPFSLSPQPPNCPTL